MGVVELKTDHQPGTDQNTMTFYEIPDPVNLADVLADLPPRRPEIIGGVLRQGHKMMVSGPSKAGKTFFLMHLAWCVATGRPWLGQRCEKGKVLYVNLELDERSCYHRFNDIGKALGISDFSGVNVLNLRGSIPSAPEFCRGLMAYIAGEVGNRGYSMVIVDPIYKLFTGSENNQEVVSEFCNSLDMVAKAGASVVYCHHHSKGIQGDKVSMDRASGSGVFARDADALIDLIQLVPGEGENIDPDHKGVTGWLMSFTLREFRPKEDLRLLFDHPLHRVCNDGRLDKAKPRTKASTGGTARGNQKAAEKEANKTKFKNAYTRYIADNGCNPTKADLAEVLGVTERTITTYCKELGGTITDGRISIEENKENSVNSLLSSLFSNDAETE